MKKLLFIAAVAFTTQLASCSKDDDAKELTKVEATTEIQTAGKSCEQEMAAITTTKAATALSTLQQLSPNGLFPNAISQVVSPEQLKSIINLQRNPLASEFDSDAELFNFEKNKGKYTYTSGKFVRSTSVTDKIVVVFPSTLTGKTNNAELTISKYTEVFVQANEEYVPTSIEAELKVDNVAVLKLSYNAALANLATQGMAFTGVASFNLTVAFAPYTLESHQTLNAAATGYSTTDNSFLKKDAQVLISTERNITAAAKSKAEDISIKGTASAQLMNLKVNGSFEFAGKVTQLEEGEFDITKAAQLNLYSFPSGSKIGTIVAEAGTDDNTIPTIIYNDGTKAPLEGIVKSLFKK
jgi:hypothetical protein